MANSSVMGPLRRASGMNSAICYRNDVCSVRRHENHLQSRLYSGHTYSRLRSPLMPVAASAQKKPAPAGRHAADAGRSGRARSRGILARRNRRPRRAENAARAVGISEVREPAADGRRERRNARRAARACRAVVDYTITPQDVAGPFIGAMPGDMMESAKLPALAYTSALEALAEKFHASPALLQNAQSRCGVGRRRHDQGAGRRAVRAAVSRRASGAKVAAGAKPAAASQRSKCHFRRDEIARRPRRRLERS